MEVYAFYVGVVGRNLAFFLFQVWTVVEEVKTETKKWVITSVIDPRTKEKISFDDALIEGILDQEHGKYCNPDTGEEMSIGIAIEKNLIQVCLPLIHVFYLCVCLVLSNESP